MMSAATNIPNVDVSMAARQYVSAGWVLVPIAKGSKGPRHTGWNTRPLCIDDEKRAGKIRGGVGLAHLFSNTCCIDLDDLARCRDWLFDEHCINLDELLDAPEAVQIRSGRENRGKLLYRLPEGVDSLVTVKVKDVGLELRCGTRDGKTVQDVLPPTIHPDTLLPYQWGGAGDWHNPPVLPDAVLEIWRVLESSVDPARAGAGVADGDPEADPVVGHLEANGWVRAKLRDGTRHIRCPFEQEHESFKQTGKQGSVGDCSYFPALTGGYAQGHFHCLHTTCDGRSDEDFLDGVGFDRHAAVAEKFDVVVDTSAATPDAVVAARRALERNKAGKALATIRNLAIVLTPEACGWRIGRDTFKDAIMWAPLGTEQWREFTDDDYTEIRLHLEREYRFQSIGREVIRDVVSHAARAHQFDSAQLWLDSLKWDGVPRVEAFFSSYFGAEQTQYHQAAAVYLWTALAGRVLDPGCKCDMVPILVGPQGAGKSTAVMAMVPAPEHYVEIDFAAKEDDLARKMRGALVAEFAELKGLRGREIEHVKAFITRQYENWTPKFKEFNQSYPRRCVFIGTTNQDEFLADETGNRRFLPVSVGRVDVEALRKDAGQLWAEAAALWAIDGVCWKDAETLGRNTHHKHMVTDPWEDAIEKWIGEEVEFGAEIRKEVGFRISDLLFGALSINARDQNRGVEMRAAAILRKLGLVKKDKKQGGRSVKCWMSLPVATGSLLGSNHDHQ